MAQALTTFAHNGLGNTAPLRSWPGKPGWLLARSWLWTKGWARGWACCMVLAGCALIAAPAAPAASATGTTANNAAQNPATAALASTSAPRWSQLGNPVFLNLNAESGLPHPAILALAEDRHGFIWVGTQGGLARWDGYRFLNYRFNPKDPHSLPDNAVNKLHIDRQGQLWVGTTSNGLARYDPAHDRFIRIPVSPAGVNHAYIAAIIDDDQGMGIWVASGNGLDHLAADGKHLQHFGHDAKNPQSLPSDRMYDLLRDRDGVLWVATEKGLARQDKKSGQFTEFPLVTKQNSGITAYALTQSADGRIWVGTISQGVFMIEQNADSAQALQSTTPNGAQLSQTTVHALREVAPGLIWIGTEGQGIVSVNSATLQTVWITNNPYLSNSLLDNSVTSLLRDRSGLVWVGNNRGVSQHNPQQTAIVSVLYGGPADKGLADGDIRAVTQDPDGSIRLGLQARGLNLIDADTTRIQWIAPDPQHPETGIPAVPATTLTPQMDGYAYIGTRRGLYRMETKSGLVKHLNLPPLDPLKLVYALYLEQNTLWIGTERGVWLANLPNGGTGQAADQPLRAIQPPGTQATLGQEFILCIIPGLHQTLWVGTNNGLYRYDRASHAVRHFKPGTGSGAGLSSNSVGTLTQDPRGRLWIGTTAGIDILENPDAPDAEPARFKHISTEEGLPNNYVNKLLPDNQGNIWASTDGGLARIAPDTLAVQALQAADGAPFSGYWADSGIKTQKGELLFGGAGGLIVVRPEQFRQWDHHPPVVISSLQIGGQTLPWGLANQTGAKVQIRPEANSIAVEFAALDYSLPGRNRHAYWLEGYDHDWTETNFARRVVSYTNLAPGTYRLRLRGSNRNGVWTEQERLLAIEVLPAWYQTWWFMLVQLLLGAGVVVALVQVRTRYLRQRQAELEAQVLQRTVELHKNQAELVQQAKIASLGTLTAGVAHEINNPANFALVGSYNLRQDLALLHQFLLKLAGDEATPELLASLQRKFDKLTESIDVIAEGTTRIRDLVRDLRTFARLDEAQWKETSLGNNLMITIKLVSAQFHEQVAITCQLDADPVLPCLPAQLNQVFMNLILNACQAIIARPQARQLQEPGKLHISSRIVADTLVMEFDDNGTGMTPDVMQKIFDPFFTTKDVGSGIGMGLSIVQSIVERHHGKIEVRSNPGQGSCFGLVLPLTGTQPGHPDA